MYVYAVPQFYCSECGAQLWAESYGPFLYGYFIVVRHYPGPPYNCSQFRQRFFWNPQEHREKHA